MEVWPRILRLLQICSGLCHVVLSWVTVLCCCFMYCWCCWWRCPLNFIKCGRRGRGGFAPFFSSSPNLHRFVSCCVKLCFYIVLLFHVLLVLLLGALSIELDQVWEAAPMGLWPVF